MENMYLIFAAVIVLGLIATKGNRKNRRGKKQNHRKNKRETWKKQNNQSQNSQYNTYPPADAQPTTPNAPAAEEKEEAFDYSYMPYKKKMLLTKTEYSFYAVLVRECHKRKMLVCPKVRLEDLAYVTDQRQTLKYRGYIKSRHVDFIVTDIYLRTLAAIELDDPSHNTEKAAKTDEFKNRLFETIKLPLFRIKAGTNYEEELNRMFQQIDTQNPAAQKTS